MNGDTHKNPEAIKEILQEIYWQDQSEAILQTLQQIQPGTGYPLLQGARPSDTVSIGDVYAVSKDVGAQYYQDRLLQVLQAFLDGNALTPISVSVTVRKGKMVYEILDGNHRFIASHLCSLKEIPVLYDQEEYDSVWNELHLTPAASKEKYVPPHLRKQQQ